MVFLYCLWKKKNGVVYFDFLQIEIGLNFFFFANLFRDNDMKEAK